MRSIDDRVWLLLPAIVWAVMTLTECRAQERDTPQNDSPLQVLYREEAQRWEMWVDSPRTRKAEIVAEPVFRWQNLSRANGQSGAMFVWTYEGRPVVVGGVFSNPENERRVIMHEFHALGPDRLFPVFRDSKSKWLPGAGITLNRLPDSPKVEDSIAKRTLQIRALAREFSANSTDDRKQRWELRLLPRPLFRYEKAFADVIDGALLAFVSDAGTDPEIVLVLEARQEDHRTAWYYRPVRLSISDLFVDYKGERIWTSLRDDPQGAFGNKDNTYGLVRDRIIDDLPSPEKQN